MITKRNRRSATLKDFIKLKKVPPFSEWRQVSKLENFGLMFGASAATFKNLLQQSDFTTEACKDFIKLTGSQKVYNDIVAHSRDKVFKQALEEEADEGPAVNDAGKACSYGSGTGEMRPGVECLYLAAATVMRENFMKGYPGLAERIEREHKFAIDHFYTRLWYGSVRWHPELAYMTIDPMTKELRKGSVDSKYSRALFSHLMNNAANAAVQSGETVFIYAGWINADYYMRKWGLKSKVFNTIHDSLDIYIYKPEEELVISLINASVHNKIRYPCEGIRHFMEAEVSDIRDYKHLTGYEPGDFFDEEGNWKEIRGHFYKHGDEQEPVPIEEAIKNYENLTGKTLEWEGLFI